MYLSASSRLKPVHASRRTHCPGRKPQLQQRSNLDPKSMQNDSPKPQKNSLKAQYFTYFGGPGKATLHRSRRMYTLAAWRLEVPHSLPNERVKSATKLFLDCSRLPGRKPTPLDQQLGVWPVKMPYSCNARRQTEQPGSMKTPCPCLSWRHVAKEDHHPSSIVSPPGRWDTFKCISFQDSGLPSSSKSSHLDAPVRSNFVTFICRPEQSPVSCGGLFEGSDTIARLLI